MNPVTRRLLVVAPHADDEVLGCAGTLLRRRSEGAEIGWLLMTEVSESHGWSISQINERQQQIGQVRNLLGVLPEHLFELKLEAARLDQIPMVDLIRRISDVFNRFTPEEVLIPHSGDIHSDHRVCFDAVAACTKWFRYPFVRRILTYETPSETDFVLRQQDVFVPNYYFDITTFFEQKILLTDIYKTEFKDHPFPRSQTNVRALAEMRGAQSGFHFAEAFQLLRERS